MPTATPATRRALLLTCLLLVVAHGGERAGAHARPDPGGPPPPPRGVVLIVTDDQGFGDFGFQGNPVIRTPHLDALAAESARVPTFYVSPVCAPTRAALMTGRYPYRTRVLETYLGRAMMDPGELTLAERLRSAGVATGVFGKWHLGDCHPMRPQDQGFDEALVHRGGGIGQPSDPLGAEGRYTDPTLVHNGREERRYGYCTRVYFDAARAWIREQVDAGRPFFAYLPTNAPHGPFHDVPEGRLEAVRARDLSPSAFPDVGAPLPAKHDEDTLARIFAMIEDVDENVGRLLGDLRDEGVLDDTLVLFLVDNGPNSRRYVRGLRGMKGDVYEGGVRSPLLARWPAALPAGDTADRVTAHLDIAPTILEACGVTADDGPPMDGRSLLPLLRGQPDDGRFDDRALVVQVHRGDAPERYHHMFTRRGPWKLVHASGFGEVARADTPFELFHLGDDPYEQRDVAADHPEVVADLRAAYDAWFDDVSATREDPWAPPRIHLGSSAEPRVVLTRQDWRRDSDDGGWSPRSLGHWEVFVAQAGAYRITVVPRAAPRAQRFALRIGEAHWRGVMPAEGPLVLPRVTLDRGPATLRAELFDDEGVFGAHQVFVERAGG